jgi:subfamily B ATP-binding cassette protein MsbA
VLQARHMDLGSVTEADRSDLNSFLRIIDREYLSFLFRYVRPHRWQVIAALVLSMPLAGLTTLLAWQFRRIIQEFESETHLLLMMVWVLVLLATMLFKNIMGVVHRYLMVRLDALVSNDVRSDLYESIQSSPLEFHLRSRGGELISLISQDVQCASAGILELLAAFWLQPVTIACLLALMFYLNPVISMFTILTLPVVAFFVSRISRRSRRAERRFLTHFSRMLGVMAESLSNIKQVKSLGLEGRQKDQFVEEGRQLVHFRCQAALARAVISPINEFVTGVVLALMIAVAYWQLSSGRTTYAAIAGCLAAAYSLRKPIESVSTAVIHLQGSVAAAHRILWILGRQDDHGQELRHDFQPPLHRLVLKDVSFSYDGRRDVLRQVNLAFKRGERIAIWGPSGSGKTTLVDLIIGFYPCSQGAIYANEVDLRTASPRSWRQQVGMVTQTPFLFDATIEDNVRYGYPKATEDQIHHALHLAGAQEMLERLPDGLKTTVGERGGRLSGGERKRVALAQALVRPISLLILDEATSELDAATEEALLGSIDALSSQMVVVNVSHRSSILRHCDRAILLRDHQAWEASPEELLAAAADEQGRTEKSWDGRYSISRSSRRGCSA